MCVLIFCVPDVNECEDPTVCGTARCVNNEGSYDCLCETGFVYVNETKSCVGRFFTHTHPHGLPKASSTVGYGPAAVFLGSHSFIRIIKESVDNWVRGYYCFLFIESIVTLLWEPLGHAHVRSHTEYNPFDVKDQLKPLKCYVHSLGLLLTQTFILFLTKLYSINGFQITALLTL